MNCSAFVGRFGSRRVVPRLSIDGRFQMYEVAAVYLALAGFLILGDWRRGLPIAVLTTIIQDPLRKLAPNEPVAFSLMAGVVAVMTLVVSLRSPQPRFASSLVAQRKNLVAAAYIFVAIIAIQCVNGYLFHGSAIAVALGALTYLGALPAILLGRHLAKTSGERAIIGFLKFYLAFMLPAVATIGLQYAGFEWSIFGEVGQGLQIYDVIVNGAPINVFSGVFRSSEIAAWHIGACCCFTTILLTQRRISASSLLVCAVIVLCLLALGVLTGRRKLLVQVSVFMIAYVFLVAFVGRIGMQLWIAVAVTLVAIWTVANSLETFFVTDVVYRQFLTRGQSGFYDAGSRFQQLGLGPLSWAYERFGLLGAGVGAATSGAQNYGVKATLVAVGEGGLGKLAGELGWPGLAAALWLGFALARLVWATTTDVVRKSLSAGRLRCGLAAFLLANFATFSVATQVFNDLFVLTVLGFFIGVLVAERVPAPQPEAEAAEDGELYGALAEG